MNALQSCEKVEEVQGVCKMITKMKRSKFPENFPKQLITSIVALDNRSNEFYLGLPSVFTVWPEVFEIKQLQDELVKSLANKKFDTFIMLCALIELKTGEFESLRSWLGRYSYIKRDFVRLHPGIYDEDELNTKME